MLTSKNLTFHRFFNHVGKYARWRITSVLIVSIMIVSAIYTTIFVYKNIYTTISNANVITELSSLESYAVDVNNYNLAEEKKIEKTKNFTWPINLRVIFNYEVSSSSTNI